MSRRRSTEKDLVNDRSEWMSQRKTRICVHVALAGCALALPCVAGETTAPAREVMVIFDLPAEAREPEVLGQAAASLTATLPTGSRLGAVAAVGQNAMLMSALADPQEAEAAIATAARETMTAADKDPAAALERALYELRIEGRADALPAVVMVSDGKTQIAGDTAAERRAWMLGPLTEEARRNRAPVYVIAVSTAADMAVLQPLARVTGGDYFRAESATQIPAMMAQAGAALASAGALAPVTAETARPEPAPALEAAAPPAVPAALPPAVAEVAAVHPAPAADALAGQVLAGVVGAGVALAAVAAAAMARRRRKVPASSAPQAAHVAVSEEARAVQAVAPAAYLNDLRGTTQFSRYALGTRPVVIGRSPGRDTRNFDYITVTLNTVSRRHAVIEYRDGAYWIVDQGSVNGTRINGQRIQGARRLCHGDRIALHRCELQFELAEAGRETATTVAADAHASKQTVTGDAHAPKQTVTGQPGRRAAVLSEPVIVPAAGAPGQSTSKAVGSIPGAARGSGDVRSVAAVVGAGTLPKAASGAAAAPAAAADPLDTFISTTLLRAGTDEHSPPPEPPAKPTEPVHLFAALDTGSREMSIEDFLGSDIVVEEPAKAPPPASLATRPLSDHPPQTTANGGRSGDTIKLAVEETLQPDATTTSLEELLRAFELQKGSEDSAPPGTPAAGKSGGSGRES
jgi:pSer/pThr/pTyr-binding forkhead associated (FHA) protein